MPRLVVILLISWAYAGCAGQSADPVGSQDLLADGGEVRLNVPDDRLYEAIVRSAVARPLVALDEPGPASCATWEAPEGACAVLRLEDSARYPDGGSVLAEDVARQWGRTLWDGEEGAWLLESLDGASAVSRRELRRISGLRADGRRLVLCGSSSAADLTARLRHPSLWHWRRSVTTELPEGPGPFVAVDSGRTVARPSGSGGAASRPKLDGVVRVVDDDPGLMMRLGEVDVAVGRGASASGMIAAAAGFDVDRLPRWDRLYALWLEPDRRWVNDPRFRGWLAGVLDRPAMVEYLFDGHAEPVVGLSPSDGEPPWPSVPRRPVSSSTEPRLVLHFDRDDADAGSIASRVRASLSTERVWVELAPVSRSTLIAELRAGRVQAAVVVHAPATRDPVLAMRETLDRLGPGSSDALTILRQASGLSEDPARAAAALAAERALVGTATLIPLVRVETYVAVRDGLRGLHAGDLGVLDFERAGWMP